MATKTVMIKGKTWDQAMVRELITSNAEATERALLHIYYRQTTDEKRIQATKHRNLRGFMPFDARKMTDFAQQVLAGHLLSWKQITWLWAGTSDRFPSRIGKYAQQILEHMEETHAEQNPTNLI